MLWSSPLFWVVYGVGSNRTRCIASTPAVITALKQMPVQRVSVAEALAAAGLPLPPHGPALSCRFFFLLRHANTPKSTRMHAHAQNTQHKTHKNDYGFFLARRRGSAE